MIVGVHNPAFVASKVSTRSSFISSLTMDAESGQRTSLVGAG